MFKCNIVIDIHGVQLHDSLSYNIRIYQLVAVASKASAHVDTWIIVPCGVEGTIRPTARLIPAQPPRAGICFNQTTYYHYTNFCGAQLPNQIAPSNAAALTANSISFNQ